MVELKVYDIGDTVTLEGAFEAWDNPSQSMQPANPTDVTVRIKLPDGTTVVKDFPADVINVVLGLFRTTFVVTLNGVHTYRFEGVGAVPTAGERSFKVRKSLVL